MSEKQCDIEVYQASSTVLTNHLQHLINTEQGVINFYHHGGADDIVPLGELSSFHEESVEELQAEGWDYALYRARLDSYSTADLESFIWGWHSEVSDALESNSTLSVKSVKEEADSAGSAEVGFTSGLVVLHEDNEMSTQLIAHTNYGSEPLQYVLAEAEEVDDVAYRLVRHPDPEKAQALRDKCEVKKSIIFRNKDDFLVPEIVTAIEGLHTALDTRFIELLKDHKIDQ